MLDLLSSRPGWHRSEEIAVAAGIDPPTNAMVLAVYHRLIARGYTTDVLERDEGRSRYRLNPHNRP